MKNRFFENRKLAWVVFAIAVLFSLSFSGGGALRDQRSAALDVFYKGAQNDGLCIDRDLKARSEAAAALIDMAGRYDIADSVVSQAAEAQAQLDAATGIADRSKANAALQGAVKDLYDQLSALALTESDYETAYSQYREFQSRGDTIRRDPYNDVAAEFNAALSGFPARLVGLIGRVQPLELF